MGREPSRGTALALWIALASFGVAIGLLALARNLERGGPGHRWRRAHASGEEVDALLAARGRTEDAG